VRRHQEFLVASRPRREATPRETRGGSEATYKRKDKDASTGDMAAMDENSMMGRPAYGPEFHVNTARLLDLSKINE
jgi:hypothetical protein